VSVTAVSVTAASVTPHHYFHCWKPSILHGIHPDFTGTFRDTFCKGNLTILRRILYLDLAKGNPKYIYK
jgi:hypothetical protein